MGEEMIDIYDEEGIHLGSERKSEVKKKGYWHNTFQCWVVLEVDGRRSVLFQKRQLDKKVNSGKLATSAGGHIQAGESVEEGIRELNEELGIYPDFSELSYLGEYKEVRVSEKENNKENQHVFLYETDLMLEDFTFQEEELAGLYVMDFEDFKGLVDGERDQVVVRGRESEGCKEEKVSISDIVGYGTSFLGWSMDRIEDIFVRSDDVWDLK